MSGVIVFVLIAIVFPLVFYALNGRLAKMRLKENFQRMKIEAVAELRNHNREELAVVKQDFYNKSKALKSMAMHLEANSLLKDKKVEQATVNYFEAIKGYLHGKDFGNFRLLINTVIDKCLPKLNQLQLVHVFKRMDTTEEDYFAELRKIDHSEYARQEIMELRLQMEMVKPAEIGQN